MMPSRKHNREYSVVSNNKQCRRNSKVANSRHGSQPFYDHHQAWSRRRVVCSLALKAFAALALPACISASPLTPYRTWSPNCRLPQAKQTSAIPAKNNTRSLKERLAKVVNKSYLSSPFELTRWNQYENE